MKTAEQLVHPFPPTWDEHSEILILGSFPSVKSREMAFFYGHPQNRFWRLVAALCDDAVPQTVEERRAFLLRHHIALWDVLASCSIVGSSDSSIRDAVPNDIRPILAGAPIVPEVSSSGDRPGSRLSSLHQSGQRRLVL